MFRELLVLDVKHGHQTVSAQSDNRGIHQLVEKKLLFIKIHLN